MEIIYASVHQKNTEKVVDYLVSHTALCVDAVNITADKNLDISAEQRSFHMYFKSAFVH